MNNISPCEEMGQRESEKHSQNTTRGKVEEAMKRKITAGAPEIQTSEAFECSPNKKQMLAPNEKEIEQQANVGPSAKTNRSQIEGESITQNQIGPECNVNDSDNREFGEIVVPAEDVIYANLMKEIQESEPFIDSFPVERMEWEAILNMNSVEEHSEENVAVETCPPHRVPKYLITMTESGHIEIRYNKNAKLMWHENPDMVLTTADSHDSFKDNSSNEAGADPISPLDKFWALLEGKCKVDTSDPDENPFEKFWPYLETNCDMEVPKIKTVYKWDDKAIEAFHRFMDAGCKPASNYKYVRRTMIRATMNQIQQFFAALSFLDVNIERQTARDGLAGYQQSMDSKTTDFAGQESPFDLLRSRLNSGNDRPDVKPASNESATEQPKEQSKLFANASNDGKCSSVNQPKPEPCELAPKISKLSLNPKAWRMPLKSPKPPDRIQPSQPLTEVSLKKDQPSGVPIVNKSVAENELPVPQESLSQPMPKAEEDPLSPIAPMKTVKPYDMPTAGEDPLSSINPMKTVKPYDIPTAGEDPLSSINPMKTVKPYDMPTAGEDPLSPINPMETEKPNDMPTAEEDPLSSIDPIETVKPYDMPEL